MTLWPQAPAKGPAPTGRCALKVVRLTKTGAGTLNLNGTNTYSGGTTIEEGTLSLGSNSAAGTGTITTQGSVIDYADGVTIANLIDIDSDTTQLQVTTGTATQSGNIGETSGPRPLEKIGAGTLNLSGTNSFTGPLTVTAGTLGLENGAAVVDTVAVTVAGSANLNVIGSETIGSLAGAGGANLATGQTLTTGGNGASTSFSGDIAGDGALTKTGAGTFSLSGNNTFGGGITLQEGTLSLGSNTAAGTGTITTLGSVIDYADGVTIANLIDIDSDATRLQVTTGTATQSGNIGETAGPRPLEKIGAGTLNLSGTNSFTGPLTVTAGTLGLENGAAVEDAVAVTVANGAILNVIGSETIGSLAGAGGANIAAGQTLTTGGNGASTSFSGGIAGDGALTKTGAGTFTLSGNNTFGGGITLQEGTLSLLSDTAAGTGTITTQGSVIDYADGVTIANAVNIDSDTTQLQVTTGSVTQSGNIGETSGPPTP